MIERMTIKPRTFLLLFGALAAMSALRPSAYAENIVFPPDAGVADVKTAYGAKGDGVTDDTAALQRAFDDLMGKNTTMYFPNGTYLVSAPVGVFGGKAHTKTRFMNLQGQSQTGVVIRLKDACPEFGNAQQPKIVLSLYEGASTGDAMHTYARNFTVDVGRGNPGAVGLRFLSNNTGAIYDVTVRSSDPSGAGYIGIDLRQSQQGPSLIKRVTVEGFDRGIEIGNSFSLVFEHIRLIHQREVGFLNPTGRTTVRGLTSQNRVPAVRNGKHGHLTLIEGTFTGGDPAANAMESESKKVFLRDVRHEGYARLVRMTDGKTVDGAAVDEWSPLPARSLFGVQEPKTLRLPIEETPEIPWEQDLTQWEKVEFSGGEDKNPLQSAVDRAAAAGKTTVYLPKVGDKEKTYVVTAPVRVHGSVNRIIGMNSILWIDGNSPDLPPGATVFVFEDLKGPVVLERFFNILKLGGWKGLHDRYLFESRTEHPVVVRNLAHGACLHNKPSPGRTWFSEDVTGLVRVGPGEKAWLRQYNPESADLDMCVVDGGQVWILGMKTEGRSRHIVATNGAKVELLGGVSYQSWKKQPLDPPVLTIQDSEVSCTLGFYHWNAPFTTLVEERQGTETRTLLRKDVHEDHLSLYRSATVGTP